MPLKKTLSDLADEARRRVPEVDADELAEMLSNEEAARPVVIDVREPDERRRGFVPGSVHIPRGVLERDVEKLAFGGRASDADLARPVVLYCGGGSRSLLAADSLREMGFAAVHSLAGGFKAWGEAGRAVEVERAPRV